MRLTQAVPFSALPSCSRRERKPKAATGGWTHPRAKKNFRKEGVSPRDDQSESKEFIDVLPDFLPKLERHPSLLDRHTSVLVVVDMQEPFLGAINGRDALTANVLLLCQAAQILKIPIIATTQYAERMGPIVPEVAAYLGESVKPIDKLTFSCAESSAFQHALIAGGKHQIVLCGLETHICISQTAHDLLHAGYRVHVATDGASSRTMEKHKLGMERIRDADIKPCASEAAVYEWLREAGTPEFKEILKLVK
jgi:nicotinamidase-related amidase